jgi:hypothetical protein
MNSTIFTTWLEDHCFVLGIITAIEDKVGENSSLVEDCKVCYSEQQSVLSVLRLHL